VTLDDGSSRAALPQPTPGEDASTTQAFDSGSTVRPVADAAPSTIADAGLTQPPYGWVGIIGTGQSLSVGATSVAISVTQPFKSLMLLDNGPDPKYPLDGSPSAMWSVVPLTEPHRPNVSGTINDNLNYPHNICGNSQGQYGETPHSGMANSISAAWAARGNTSDYATVHSVVGVGGFALAYIAKGTVAYSAALSEARVYKKLATAAGKTYGVGAVILTHGEADTTLGTADYGEKVYAMLQDFNADLKPITGQKSNVILLASQQSSQQGGYNGPSVQLWRAGRDHPGEVVCTGPKYAYGPYYVHMQAPGYERIGEKYGEVFDLIVNQGVAWKPVGPKSISRTGKVITIAFDVPNPPLAWDEHLVKPHQKVHTAWANGRGFEVIDGANNEVTVASVEISGESVLLTLAQEPAAGTALTVGYAVTPDADGGSWGGHELGMHGQLRDSDTFPGYAVESIEVQATQGSPLLKGAPSAFLRRGDLDIVSGGNLAADTVIADLGVDSVTLSSPWTGPTGKATLTFHHNHYNYCVHFSSKVP
jgi:hypothetical protein